MAIAAGYGAGHLGLTLFAGGPPVADARIAPERVAVARDAVAPQDIVPWPDAFGVFVPDAVAPPPPPEPEEVVVNLDYTLTGLFASASSAWAIVAGPDGEHLLRKGDELPGGVLVQEITRAGVELQTPQGRQMIAFEEN
ncbi:type II secretion system protein N [Neptunicoccus sediminis]|uniref:type II secretion system protein N n=1 Tax=Neptunicoccus sediminis TaxID=1892596 RepID=UPI000845C63F|nr:type II secretion system protein N [Neptunicoccus sediminis]